MIVNVFVQTRGRDYSAQVEVETEDGFPEANSRLVRQWNTTGFVSLPYRDGMIHIPLVRVVSVKVVP